VIAGALWRRPGHGTLICQGTTALHGSRFEGGNPKPMTDPGGTLGTPSDEPFWPAAVKIADRDGGVSRRLLMRCRIAGSAVGLVGLLLLVAAALRPWNTLSAGLVLVATLVLIGATLLICRARIWSAVAGWVLPAGTGFDAIVGAPRRLSPGVPGAPVKRRFGALVVPIHRASGPQPGQGALIVHARADQTTLAERDAVRLWRVDARSSAPPTVAETPVSGAQNQSVGGRFVLVRIRDGAVFLATTRLSDTW
jgi:hypothetical protein